MNPKDKQKKDQLKADQNKTETNGKSSKNDGFRYDYDDSSDLK
ncbi:hypothetical protein LC048_18650 [Mesobacillus subterraneus]|nr:hypothetical protein [Mesobacillus subterraneus]WLR54434.1 hypothetical protein LC048_18650 [Mesobacillus subterraneus]